MACTASDDAVVTVNALPVVTADDNSVCTGSSVAVSGSPAGGTWSGGHINATTGVFNAAGLAAGTYTVTYTFTNGNGCTASDDAVVTVKALPVVTATDNSVCSGSTVQLTGSPAGGTWSGGHINATTGVFNAAGLAPGTYTVTYTVTSNGCTASDIAIVTVKTCGPDIFPTATACSDFTSGTTVPLANICATIKKSKVSNATPGVFFYYTYITAPKNGSFTVTIDQKKSCSDLAFFALANAQINAYKSNCNGKITGSVVAGVPTVTITNATLGQIFVISVKYDTKSIVGASATGTGPCTYTFKAVVDGVLKDDTQGQIDVLRNCSAFAAATPMSSSISTETPAALKVTAAPNPFTSVVNFSFVAPVSGKANLELYDLVGKKLAVVFSGDVKAGAVVSVKCNMPAGHAGPVIYKLDVGDKSAHGTLIPLK
jgi:hypothetical protein